MTSDLPPSMVLKSKRFIPYQLKSPVGFSPYQVYSKQERKLFVGMLNKKYEEADVRTMFSAHGPIEECTVLRDQNGQSRGCAFVTFGSRQYAIAAIKTMHQSLTMEGCSSPLVVKFADTQKEKDAKRLHSVGSTLLGTSAIASPALNPQYLALLQQIQTNSQLTAVGNPALATPLTAPNPLAAGLPTLASTGLLPPTVPSSATLTNGVGGLKGLASGTPVSLGLTALAGHQAPDLSSTAHLPAVFGTLPTACSSALGQPSVISPLTMSSLGPMAPLGSYPAPAPSLDTLTLHHLPGYPAYPPCSLAPQSHVTSGSGQAVSGMVTGRQTEGPDGCNLFIYHLPPEFSDSDLIQAFAPYGTVVSAKVFLDKQTNLSKCFGFVSYDCGTSALAAIQAMNGFQIGTKRLKVQLKRSKEANKPY